ncbi:phenylalanine--tRNA ligase subunit alpha [Candidatus Parcubacteria bacterium]|nr:phenylalanine--tRNA ligase subunit alpha [Candidatus Parcubacteria bacterium]
MSGKKPLENKAQKGHIHPLSHVTKQMADIFQSMGFSVVLGPEIDTEYYNFDALNIPKNHPARDMWDTFWIKNEQFHFLSGPRSGSAVVEQSETGARWDGAEKLLLRTHTSPMQVRFMEKNNPPFQIVVPGRCYRYEATDSTHEIQFNQLEGLMIGEDITLANLKGVLEEFFKKLFNKKVEIRFRPSYFPFTEPSVEVDLRLKGEWLEIAGAGMVHPQVLKNVKIDPDKWQGFAFGVGIDRVAMLKYKIDDIRLFYGSDMRFLKQF